MKILIIGIGAVGSIYGYIFQNACYEVSQMVRDQSTQSNRMSIQVQMLDARTQADGVETTGTYLIRHATEGESFDYIFISVTLGNLKSVLEQMRRQNLTGNIILACNLWDDVSQIRKLMLGKRYVIGYPIAGGNLNAGNLDCCVTGQFLLEPKEKTNIPHYQELSTLMSGCSITIQTVPDMLQWIWLHMAINAGFISTIGTYGDVRNLPQSFNLMMDDTEMLIHAVLAVREAVQIAATRGIDLRYFSKELLPYRFPANIAAMMIKHQYARNIPMRKIMMLHGNLQDLENICKAVVTLGQQEKVPAPVLYQGYEDLCKKITSLTTSMGS